MIKFPSIEQFRNVIRNVQNKTQWAGTDENGEPKFDRSRVMPTIKYRATVKLHGTNSGIRFTKSDTVFQSRNNEITLESDNAGFVNYIHDKLDNIRSIFDFNDNPEIVIYGEWCGKGIQKGVAIAEVEKMFVIFAIKINESWQDIRHWSHVKDWNNRIYNIMDFKTWEFDIDFNNPQAIQNSLIDVCNEVEAECPVGKYFGVSGVGEGIVLTPVACTMEWHNNSGTFFKIKGEKHSVSKVKTLAPVDVEKMEKLSDFIEYAVTENRLQQGIDYLKEQHLEPIDKNTAAFLRWVVDDVIKEENQTIRDNNLDLKDACKLISKTARSWYFKQLNA